MDVENLPAGQPIITVVYETPDDERDAMEILLANRERKRRAQRAHERVEHIGRNDNSPEPQRKNKPVVTYVTNTQQRPIGANDSEIFWNMIGCLGWQELPPNAQARVNEMFEKYPDCVDIFRAEYSKAYGILLNAVLLDRILDRVKLSENQTVANISWIISLGKDTYSNLSMDMEMCQMMIDPMCPSFDILLPHDMRMS